MKVKIGNSIYDSEIEPIMLIFESDEDRINTVSHLSNMIPKEGVRKYLQFPSEKMNSEEINNFMKI